MDAGFVGRSHVRASSSLQSVGGWLCIFGFAGITVTSLLYALAPPQAALPVPAFDGVAAMSGAKLGAGLLRAASLVGILSDIIAASGALLVGQLLARQDRALAAAGWAGVVLSIMLFTIVDTMAGLVLVPLATDPAMPAAFIAAKRLFDALFLTGTIAFGFGLIVFLAAGLRQPIFAWGWPVSALGIAIGVVAAAASLACIAGAPAYLAVGGAIGAGSVLCTWLAVRITRTA